MQTVWYTNGNIGIYEYDLSNAQLYHTTAYGSNGTAMDVKTDVWNTKDYINVSVAFDAQHKAVVETVDFKNGAHEMSAFDQNTNTVAMSMETRTDGGMTIARMDTENQTSWAAESITFAANGRISHEEIALHNGSVGSADFAPEGYISAVHGDWTQVSNAGDLANITSANVNGETLAMSFDTSLVGTNIDPSALSGRQMIEIVNAVSKTVAGIGTALTALGFGISQMAQGLNDVLTFGQRLGNMLANTNPNAPALAPVDDLGRAIQLDYNASPGAGTPSASPSAGIGAAFGGAQFGGNPADFSLDSKSDLGLGSLGI